MTPDKQAIQHREDIGRYVDCFVAFLDILGFKRKVLDSQNNREILVNIIESLKIVNAIPTGGKEVSTYSGGQRTIQIRSRSFSDSLVFFLEEKLEDMTQLFFLVRYLVTVHSKPAVCLRFPKGGVGLFLGFSTRLCR